MEPLAFTINWTDNKYMYCSMIIPVRSKCYNQCSMALKQMYFAFSNLYCIRYMFGNIVMTEPFILSILNIVDRFLAHLECLQHLWYSQAKLLLEILLNFLVSWKKKTYFVIDILMIITVEHYSSYIHFWCKRGLTNKYFSIIQQ